VYRSLISPQPPHEAKNDWFVVVLDEAESGADEADVV
jgi:hypothetical protein